MKNQKFTLGLLLTMAVLLTVGWFVNVGNSIGSGKSSQQLAEIGFFQFDKPRVLGAVPLKDLEGREVTLTNRHQQWQLVNFGYMFCPDICPINLRFMSDLKILWDQESGNTPFAITHVTFDPERDTPDRLSQYLDYHNKDYAGLTGELDDIRKIAQQLNVLFIHEKPDEYGNYFITHSDSIGVINPQGEFVGMFKGPYEMEKVVSVLEQLIN